MTRVVDVWAIQILQWDDNKPLAEPVWLRSALAEAEENLSDLLPDGYTVRITRWDDEGAATDE